MGSTCSIQQPEMPRLKVRKDLRYADIHSLKISDWLNQCPNNYRVVYKPSCSAKTHWSPPTDLVWNDRAIYMIIDHFLKNSKNKKIRFSGDLKFIIFKYFTGLMYKMSVNCEIR